MSVMASLAARVAWLILAVVGFMVLPHDDRSYSQSYPARAVRLINPFPPGGAVDVMARVLAQKLSENLGQQFVVESRSGPAETLDPSMSQNPRRTATRFCLRRPDPW